MKRNKNRDYNIDLLFKGVSFVHFPTDMEGLTLIHGKDSILLSEFYQKIEHVISKNHLLFILEDKNEKNILFRSWL